jgi:hypothetical protein
MITSAPKFGKIEILVKNNHNIDREEYDDCGLVITGNYLIVVIDERNDIENSLTTTGKIFNLENIKSYKTYSK